MPNFNVIVSGDDQLHVFKTFMGMIPDTDTPPVCGKVLTSSYNGRGKPKCPECEHILRRSKHK